MRKFWTRRQRENWQHAGRRHGEAATRQGRRHGEMTALREGGTAWRRRTGSFVPLIVSIEQEPDNTRVNSIYATQNLPVPPSAIRNFPSPNMSLKICIAYRYATMVSLTVSWLSSGTWKDDFAPGRSLRQHCSAMYCSIPTNLASSKFAGKCTVPNPWKYKNCSCFSKFVHF